MPGKRRYCLNGHDTEADAAGISVSSVSKCETGPRPSSRVLVSVAKALGVTVADMYPDMSYARYWS